jgi:Subtilase family
LKRNLIRALALAAIAGLAACSGSSMGQQSMPPTQQSEPGQMVQAPGGGETPENMGEATPLEAGSPVTLPGQRGMMPLASGVNLSPESGSYRSICGGDALLPGHSQCYAIFRTDSGARAFEVRANGLRTNASCNGTQPGCYGAEALQAAYNITKEVKTGGKGMTIALVDAFGYPGVQKDLAAYRKIWGLPACSTAPCFRVVNQKGQTSGLPKVGPADDDWRGEQALDIDMASAMCPNCNLILVQTTNDENNNLQAGVNAAAALHANVISNSYGCPEKVCGASATNSNYNHPGIVITASAGDSGYGVAQPCSLSTVFCVGGTSLNVDKKSARGYAETVWDGLKGAHECSGGSGPLPCATGSGCSTVVEKPSWQHDKGCTWRSESDLSADADPFTGVVVACTPCGGNPFLTGDGGTSASSPMIAAMVALAGNANKLTPAALWAKNGAGFNDVVTGQNDPSKEGGSCPAAFAYICKAGKGYDGPTGWGTPDGLGSL